MGVLLEMGLWQFLFELLLMAHEMELELVLRRQVDHDLRQLAAQMFKVALGLEQSLLGLKAVGGE